MAALLVLPMAATAATLPTSSLDQVQQKMAGLAVPFEANQGQFAPEVAFAARTFAGTVFVTRDGQIVHAFAGKLQKEVAHYDSDSVAAPSKPDDRTRRNQTPRGPGWALVESMQGAGELAPAGSQPSATRVSRFAGGAAPNQTSNIATFDRVDLGKAWPGVTVELAARGSNVEKLFTVASGTNPKKIHMGLAGAKRLRVGTDGSLIATTGNGDIAFTPPVAFQNIGGQRSTVSVRYVLLADNGYRFETGAYDRSQPLVIDPLLQSTYLGGPGGVGQDQANALAIDASGNVLVAGLTDSPDFPGTMGGVQPLPGGGFGDAFIARLSSNLGTLMQATYLGGNGSDQSNALALDSGGNVLIAGYTSSTNFPGTIGGARPASGGGFDAFVARLSSNLGTLVQATYLGGSGFDSAAAVALDAGGNVLVAGYTSSSNFPGISGGAQPASGGGSNDAFVARLSNTLTTLVRATYLGGNGDDQGTALAIDAGGNVLVAGYANSTNFPGTSGGAQAAYGGGDFDSFVARLSNNLALLMQATYLGGSADDRANALALDAGGKVLIAGYTTSTNLPGTTGGAQAASGGGFDAFVARLSSTLTTVVQATYLGGTGGDAASALALDAGGNVLVAGATNSTTFPRTTGCVQPASGGSTDAFVARLSSTLTMLVRASYLGGSGIDQSNALALDTGGNVLVAGLTNSVNFPGAAGGAQSSIGGGSDAFVAKLTPSLCDSIFSNGFE